MAECTIVTRQRILHDLMITLPSGDKINLRAEDVVSLFEQLGRHVGMIDVQVLARQLMSEHEARVDQIRRDDRARAQREEDRLNCPG